jgi:hypothetical protein
MMNKLSGAKMTLFRQAAWLFVLVVLVIGMSEGQQAPEPTQEDINKRVADIMEHALQQGIGTTPEGYRYTRMRASTSMEEYKEIKKFGERAIAPLSNYLDSEDYRAQHLAVNLLGSIGGKAVIKPLAHAAEKCSYIVARSAALANLAHQNWDDVAEIIKWVSVNDPEPFVRKDATDLIAKHAPEKDTR